MSHDADLVNVPATADISSQFRRSLASLKSLTALLYRQPGQDQFKSGLAKALEEYGKLSTWGEENRAALPNASRGSLDETLRKNGGVKDMVVNILAKIERQAEDAIQTTQITHEGSATLHGISLGTNSDEDTESSSEDDTWSDDDGSPSKKPAVWRILRHIEEDIRSLFQVSLMIVRPGFSRRYIHSTNQDNWDPRVAHYVDFDLRHVEEKLLDWGRPRFNEDAELIATPELLEQRTKSSDMPGFLANLSQRLARANTKRREQLFYWSKHPDKAPIVVEIDISTKTKTIHHHGVEHEQSENSTKPRLVTPHVKDTESRAPQSITSKHTFSTVVVSDVFGPRTVTGPTRTIYAESILGRQRSNRVPDAPSTILHGATFECPYCHLVLDSNLMRSRQEWKRHVFRDLRPYVCSFEDCQNPDKQFQTRHDWIYHEMQTHRRKWICEEHNMDFLTRDLFIEHVRSAHALSISDLQLPVLVEISERPCDEMEVYPCPFCPEERRLNILRTHVAEHLESIALFALPANAGAPDGSDVDRDENDQDGNSDGAADGGLSSRVDDSDMSDAWSSRRSVESKPDGPDTLPTKDTLSGNLLGLTIMYDPGIEPSADIIFVHGLGGNSHSTWSADKSEESCWPKKWLPVELNFSSVRIMTFGYATDLESGSPGMTEVAKDLLYSMKDLYDDEASLRTVQRPIIFVAHSLGGIIIKKAYLLGQNDAHYEPLTIAIRGIVFLATPHRSSGYTDVLRRITEATVPGLSRHRARRWIRDSLVMQDINDQFHHVAPLLFICSLYETRLTTTGKEKSMIVKKDSAEMGFPDERSLPLDANHCNICKYSNVEDPNYITVRNVLGETIVSSTQSTQNEPTISLKNQDLERPILELDEKKRQEMDRQLLDFKEEERQSEFKRLRLLLGIDDESIKFEDDLQLFRERRNTVECEWILEDPSFTDWFNSDGVGLAWLYRSWIREESFMASFILDHVEKCGASCAYYSHAGSGSQPFNNSLSKTLKSLFVLIAQHLPSFVTQLLAQENIENTLRLDEHDLVDVWRALIACLRHGLRLDIGLPSMLFLIIDSLEYLGEFRSSLLVQMLGALFTLEGPGGFHLPIKVLLVGPYQKEVEEELKNMSQAVPPVPVAFLPIDERSTQQKIRENAKETLQDLAFSEDIKAEIISVVTRLGTKWKEASEYLRMIVSCRDEESVRDFLRTIKEPEGDSEHVSSA